MPSTKSNRHRDAEKHLRSADPVMARLIDRHGPCRIGASKNESLFHSLASAIIAQQLSVKAADTIQKRVMNICSKPLTPKSVALVSDEELRSAGLSRSKTAYIRNIAETVLGGLSKQKLQRLEDHEVLKELTAIKGIGQWTAEMYLIFGLHRPDVISLGDAGLQRAARQLYNRGDARDGLLTEVSEKWKPYRSVACWYLWQSLDNKPL